MNRLSDNLRGALLMVGAMSGFTVNDAFMKSVSSSLPLFQAIFLRGMLVVPAMIVLCLVLGQLRLRHSPNDWKLILIRSLGEIGGTFFFISALFNMPLANVSAILQALPLTVSLAAALVFREPLGWRRMAAILIGFCGVLLIVRPGGADFNVYSLYALGAVVSVTIRDLAARRVSASVPSVFIALVAAVLVMVFAGTMSIGEGWAPITSEALWRLLGATGFIIAGYVCSVSAMRVGEISIVAPFRYTSLIVALILGYAMFGEVPKLLTVLGAIIVVATGLFTLYRQTRRSKLRASLIGRVR
jgi:S-adenosylmethionine uptake transporter